MNDVVKIRTQDARFGAWSSERSGFRLAPLISADISRTLTLDLIELRDCSTLHEADADELLLCVAGAMEIRGPQIDSVLRPGDVLWMPHGVSVTLRSDHCRGLLTRYAPDRNSPMAKQDRAHPVAQPCVARRADLKFSPLEDALPAGTRADFAVYIGLDKSSTIGCAASIFDGCSIPWTVQYDEVIYVVEGSFHMPTGHVTHEACAEELLWVPAGTAIRYEGKRANVYTTIYPLDWRSRQQ